MDLFSWLFLRIRLLFRFFVFTLHLPIWLSASLILIAILLFFYALYDIYLHRDRGNIALIWLLVVVIVPLSGIIYIFFGYDHVRKAPIVPPVQPSIPPPPMEPGATPLQQPAQAQSDVSSYGQTEYNQAMQKKYFLGATTALGGAVALIAVIAGCIALVFFIMVVVSIIQCMNDPKCM